MELSITSSAWAFFGLFSALMTAAMFLLQEKLRVNGFALAFWCKIACVIALFPLVIVYGLPRDMAFYLWVMPTAVMYAIADVILFRHLPDLGAGVISRLMPITVIAGFFLWFAFDPGSIHQYIDKPLIGGMIAAALGGAAYFSARLRKCIFTMKALRVLWFLMLCNTFAPALTKLAMNHADALQGGIAYTFVQALMMVLLWLAYLFAAKPMPAGDLLKRHSLRNGLLLGTLMAFGVTVYVLSVAFVDNPGYVSAVRLVSAVMIVAVHKMTGKKDDSDVASGFGVVGCTAAIIVLKEQL